MLKVAVVGSLLLLLASLSPAFAYEFPGKGDRQSWLQACDLSNQAGQLFQMGNFADAFKGFETSIQLYAFDAVLFYNAGVAHQTFAYLPANAATKNAELQTAEKYFLEALKLKSDEVQILAHLANVQTELGKSQESLTNLQKILTLANATDMDKANAMQAISGVKQKLAMQSPVAISNTNTAQSSSATSPHTQVATSSPLPSSSSSNWKTYKSDNSGLSLKYPAGWNVSVDQKSGEITLVNADGSKISILPFLVTKKITAAEAPGFFSGFTKVFEPKETWSPPEVIGTNALRSMFANDKEEAVAALLLNPVANGTSGTICVVRAPKGKLQSLSDDIVSQIMGSMQIAKSSAAQANISGTTNSEQNSLQELEAGKMPALPGSNRANKSNSEQNSLQELEAGKMPALPGANSSEQQQSQRQEPELPEPSQQSEPLPADATAASAKDEEDLPTSEAGLNEGSGLPGLGNSAPLPNPGEAMGAPSGLAPTAFNGWTTFRDPDQNSFTVEVPTGWKVEGGMVRPVAIDARPWVKATSPDGLITAFIGDGKIPPFTMPTATLSSLGFWEGRKYNGSEIRRYIPARRFAELYALKYMKPYFKNIQVVEQHDHPDVARDVNGTVGATRSEAASIKLHAMYGNLPAVSYYLAVTKATVMNGTGMWWVTKVAGSVGPADREAAVLGVILHMLQTFQINPEWGGQAVATAGQVSRNYRAAAQRQSDAIMNNYWSQQAANDRLHQAYWNRQAVQDRAANNFSDAIRGVENVQDPNTGTKYQVEYGPRYHWIDNLGNYTNTENSSPGPEWRQLLSVPR
jgi:hypothetical protein